MKFSCILLLCIFTEVAFCQPGRGLWTNNYGTDRSSLRDVYVCEDGGYVAAGSSGIQRQYWDVAFVVKTDANGRQEWEVFLDLFEDRGVERLSTIIEADNGDFVVGGNAGNQFIGARLNSRGDLIWAHVYGGENPGWCSAVIETKADGFLFGGSIAGDQAVVMTDGDGEVIWEETYDGGADSEYIRTMREVEGVGYFFAGVYGNVWTTLTKITGPGEPEWRRFYESEERRICCDQLLTVGNRFYLAGQSVGNNGNECALFLLDHEGNVVWDRFHLVPYVTAVMGATQTLEDGVNFVGQYDERGMYGAYCFGVNHSGDSLNYQRYGVNILLSVVTDQDGFSVACGGWMRPAFLLKMNPVESPPVIISKYPSENDLFALSGDTVRFGIEAFDHQGDSIRYLWRKDLEFISDKSTVEIVFSELGTFQISCFVIDEEPGDSANWIVTVTDLYVSAFTPDTLDLAVSRGSSVDFSLDTIRYTDGNEPEILWTKTNFSDGQSEETGSDAGATIDFPWSGEYSVEGRVSRGESSDAVMWHVDVKGAIWAYVPVADSLSVLPDSIVHFEVVPSAPDDESIEVAWLVDGELVREGELALDWVFGEADSSADLNRHYLVRCLVADSVEADTVKWVVKVNELGVGSDKEVGQAGTPILLGVSPNPFNSTLTIRYQSVKSVQSVVNISIYDIAGREVANLPGSTGVTAGRGFHPATEGGATEHQITWDAFSAPAGVYFVRLQAGGDINTKKVVLIR